MTKHLTHLLPRLFLFLVLALLTACQTEPSTAPDSQGEADVLAVGEGVYVQHCAVCHGANLEGELNWQQPNADGTFRAPPHNDTGHTWHHADQYLWERTKYGTAVLPPNLQAQSNMPAYDGVLTDAEITAVLTFIKSSWPPDIQEIQASMNNE